MSIFKKVKDYYLKRKALYYRKILVRRIKELEQELDSISGIPNVFKGKK